MNRFEIIEAMEDYMINEVNEYIQGKKNWRGEQHVRAGMRMVIEGACEIYSKGIEIGSIHFSRYKKEIKRRKKYWGRVRCGETIDSRKGFEKERLGISYAP